MARTSRGAELRKVPSDVKGRSNQNERRASSAPFVVSRFVSALFDVLRHLAPFGTWRSLGFAPFGFALFGLAPLRRSIES
jgi:hypothetical protein